jgi:hypothetical protein
MIADGSHVPESRVAEEQPHAHVAHGAIVLLKKAAENREQFLWLAVSGEVNCDLTRWTCQSNVYRKSRLQEKRVVCCL